MGTAGAVLHCADVRDCTLGMSEEALRRCQRLHFWDVRDGVAQRPEASSHYSRYSALSRSRSSRDSEYSFRKKVS